jgi:hypothetical protein
VHSTRSRVCFVNTHFDHESEGARVNAAATILAMLPEVSQGLPTVVVGARVGGGGGRRGARSPGCWRWQEPATPQA